MELNERVTAQTHANSKFEAELHLECLLGLLATPGRARVRPECPGCLRIRNCSHELLLLPLPPSPREPPVQHRPFYMADCLSVCLHACAPQAQKYLCQSVSQSLRL